MSGGEELVDEDGPVLGLRSGGIVRGPVPYLIVKDGPELVIPLEHLARYRSIAGIPVDVPHRLDPIVELALPDHSAPGCGEDCDGTRISGYPCRCHCHRIGPW